MKRKKIAKTPRSRSKQKVVSTIPKESRRDKASQNRISKLAMRQWRGF